jgi:uncharacterized protein YbcV (DUF1398 family)
MLECSRASEEERIGFAEVVRALMGAGVERYHADLTRGEKTYYMPDGASHTIANTALAAAPSLDVSAAGIEAALRAIQGGRIKYREFCARIAAAGCVGYMVSLAGRRAVYYGRTAEVFTEYFPGARP